MIVFTPMNAHRGVSVLMCFALAPIVMVAQGVPKLADLSPSFREPAIDTHDAVVRVP